MYLCIYASMRVSVQALHLSGRRSQPACCCSSWAPRRRRGSAGLLAASPGWRTRAGAPPLWMLAPTHVPRHNYICHNYMCHNYMDVCTDTRARTSVARLHRGSASVLGLPPCVDTQVNTDVYAHVFCTCPCTYPYACRRGSACVLAAGSCWRTRSAAPPVWINDAAHRSYCCGLTMPRRVARFFSSSVRCLCAD